MTNYTVGALHLGAFTTKSGEAIGNLKLRYKHVGYLGQSFVVVCRALTGSHLTYGTDEYPGQWREIIDGGYMPMYDYQPPAFNVIGNPFGSSFPLDDAHLLRTITLRDIIKAIELGTKTPGFTKIDILIDGSLGGMQVMELLYNHRFEVNKAIILTTTGKISSYSRVSSEIVREAIHVGDREGLSIARQLGFLMCCSSKSYGVRFTPNEVVNYRRHQGNKLKESYDLSCYLTTLNVLDSHYLDRQRNGVDEVLQSLNTKVLTMGFTNDLLYPGDQVGAIRECFRHHRHFFVLDSVGHGGFLLNFNDWVPNSYHFLKVSKFKRK